MGKPKRGTSPDVQTAEAAESSRAVSVVSDGRPVLSQGVLIDDDQLAVLPEAGKKTKAFLHTGKILSKEDGLIARVIEGLLLGHSMRRVAKLCGVGRNSVAEVRDQLTEAGKLEPHKQRVSKKLGRLVEATLDSLTDKAERGVLPANIEVIAMGIGIDKKGQIDAGVVPGTELREPELDPEVIRRKWAEMKGAKVIDVKPIESPSVPEEAKAP